MIPAQLQPWYREPWPWLLMAGPATVVLAGAITTYLAVATSDGLVADDYYKRGLAINQTLSRDAAARERNYRAQVTFAPGYGRVFISLSGGGPVPAALVLRLSHPARPALDRLLTLPLDEHRKYTSAFPPLTPGRWRVTLEDTGRQWRLIGDILLPGSGFLELAPR
jgi:hypothetical protein